MPCGTSLPTHLIWAHNFVYKKQGGRYTEGFTLKLRPHLSKMIACFVSLCLFSRFLWRRNHGGHTRQTQDKKITSQSQKQQQNIYTTTVQYTYAQVLTWVTPANTNQNQTQDQFLSRHQPTQGSLGTRNSRKGEGKRRKNKAQVRYPGIANPVTIDSPWGKMNWGCLSPQFLCWRL